MNPIPLYTHPEGADLDRLLRFQARAIQLQERDWELYGVVPEDGPRFIWFRTCRKCGGRGSILDRVACPDCRGIGYVHQTKKRRGQPVDAGFLRFVRGLDSCPVALRGAR